MDTWIFAVAAFAAGLMGVWIAVGRRRKFAHDSQEDASPAGALKITRNQPSRRRRFYYGVSVHPGPNACKAVEKIRVNRYLTHEAPKLPLPGCKRTHCRCFLMPEDDRRVGFDRRGDSFSAFGDYNPHEYKRRRKAGPDRRGK